MTDDPAANLRIILDKCKGLDTYTQSCCVLTAYAESDFENTARQGLSFGVFQQIPEWWPGNLLDVAHATDLFLNDFTSKTSQHTGIPVVDCWLTQRWAAPDPIHDRAGFLNAVETKNYTRRVNAIPSLLKGIIP